MPCGDGSGPWWMSGRGYRCYGYAPINPWCRGRGMSLGRGFWWHHPSRALFPKLTPADERKDLEGIARRLEEDLKAIRERIEQLGSNQ